MSVAATDNRGLMLAMMEPPASLEDEFQQWYDSEHFPERRSIEGFLTANRIVCIDGWPRYAAMYDLSDLEVMRGTGYANISGDNYSRWTDRIMGHVWGQYRAEATQIYPGKALFGDNGACSRVALWRFRAVTETLMTEIVDGLRTLYEERPETAQVRVFRSQQQDAIDCLGIVELHSPWKPAEGQTAVFGAALKHLDLVNIYTRYQRVWGGTYPQQK
ncbi:hypothetical protein [Microbaculum marinum]|uniref:Uncharacterized protein n=1 Tax=Microbaculum marinum TaxID=1764581 RepID=A0AAW9RNU5_9HYPH